MKNITYQDESLVLDLSHNYANGQPAIVLIASDGQPYAKATTCTGEALLNGETIIDTNNMEGILEVLIEEGIVSQPTGLSLSGWCSYPIVKLL
jgi:hypothetical protein